MLLCSFQLLRCMLVYLDSKIFYSILTSYQFQSSDHLFESYLRCFGSLFITISVFYLFLVFFFFFFLLLLFSVVFFLMSVFTFSKNYYIQLSFIRNRYILSQTELLVIKTWFYLKFKLHACYIRFVFP